MRIIFEINDGTETFKVIFYLKDEHTVPTALKHFDYEQNCYAKVFGSIRIFKEDKAIVGTHIKKVEKFDEVTNHFLQVFVAHNIRKKGVLSVRLGNVILVRNKNYKCQVLSMLHQQELLPLDLQA